MGVVYRANDPVIGRTVAVKTIRLSEEGTGLTRPELLTRFQTEARAAGLLTHPNIVVVFDAGEENGLYYITMELVEGKSLQALLDNGHIFTVPRILRILEQTCSALQFAHDRNIIHRDIKPANLMLTPDDTVKVTDFGTAKILQFGTTTQTTNVMGTPSYMSPEQVKGRPVDGRSDIFSLGVLFYEMLTGEKPFPGQSITTVIYKIVNEEPIPPRQLNPSVHPGLNEIVLRALSKDPDTRYQSCRDLQDDLRNYRTLGSERNPDATLVSPRPAVAAPVNSAPGLRGLHNEDPMASPRLRALESRNASPQQTPSLRNTGAIAPVREAPEKSSRLSTLLVALLLVTVILWGVHKLQPEFQAARERNGAPSAGTSSANPLERPPTLVTTQPSQVLDSSSQGSNGGAPPENTSATSPTPTSNNTADSNVAAVPTADATAEKPIQTAETNNPAAATVTASNVTPAAAEYKGRIEEALAEKGLTNRVKIAASGNSLTLTGKLRPTEHSALLHFMRGAPSELHVVDDILYDDAAVPGTAGSTANDAHPTPAKGNSALHVITDVLGATATIFDAGDRELSDCQTPCSFNNLKPGHYSVQVEKDGYVAVQSAVDLKAGQAQDQKFHLEVTAKGLYISSHPTGADIYINGAKQAGQTPATLPLAAGHYTLMLRKPGFVTYSVQVLVKDTIQTTLDVPLGALAEPQVAWAQVTTTPAGAQIVVDGILTGQVTPARVQVSAGSHILGLRLIGYQVGRRAIQVSEGGTVTVSEALQKK